MSSDDLKAELEAALATVRKVAETYGMSEPAQEADHDDQ